MHSLTKRQLEIYQYLQEHALRHDFSPSIDDVCQAMGVKSRGSMHKHIQALIAAGLIEPFNGQKRGIKLTQSENSDESAFIQLPLLGKIAAGTPIEAIETPENIAIPTQLYNGGECFVLTISGESMIDMGIDDGDWVVIENTNFAKNGDIVVALIDDDEASLKRFEKKGDKIILHPENTNMPPMIFNANRVNIQGKLVGHMRKFF